MTIPSHAEFNKALNIVKNTAQNEERKTEMEGGWNKVLDHIQIFCHDKRKTLKNFEVHHMIEMARYRFICDLAENKPIDQCINNAINSVIH